MPFFGDTASPTPCAWHPPLPTSSHPKDMLQQLLVASAPALAPAASQLPGFKTPMLIRSGEMASSRAVLQHVRDNQLFRQVTKNTFPSYKMTLGGCLHLLVPQSPTRWLRQSRQHSVRLCPATTSRSVASLSCNTSRAPPEPRSQVIWALLSF